MMNKTTCPEDVSLWSFVMEDSADTELQTHLEQCVLCQQRLISLQKVVNEVRGARWDSSVEVKGPQPAEPLPESIGGYTILARLGSGGQATVYRAWHPRLKTDVVIKWFHQDVFLEAEPSELTSLAHTLCTIRHPYLAQVFDVGIDQGRHFIIMEFISGHTFSVWIRRFTPTIPRIAAVLANAARAVDAVHKQGALHLDLKPGNIMIDDDGNPRVIDFGMAQLQGHGAQLSLLLAPGTPEYMSPEQCAGDTRKISVESDVYGLGAVLYAALCEHPIRSADEMRLEPDWTLIRKSPWTLQRICRTALSLCPQDRHASASAFAHELERFAAMHSNLRRAVSVALILLGMSSIFWGGVTWIANPPSANLVIEHQRQQKTEDRVVYEMQCAAILSNRRLPCLMVATATTTPISMTKLTQESDANWRIAKFRNPETWLQVANNAGPHLVLACAKRDWTSQAEHQLIALLQSLKELPLKYPIEILVSHNKIQLIPSETHEISSHETEQQEFAVATARQIQACLNQSLPCYSGIVVIPSMPTFVASLADLIEF